MAKTLQQIGIEGTPDLASYDRILVAFSGGKDSLACLLHLLEQGVPKDRIELWHHDVDGRGPTFFDWPITASYCQAVADALGVSIYFSWRDGGFRRELLKTNDFSGLIRWETPEGELGTSKRSPRAQRSTRRRFPQVGADLRTRWCGPYLKIDVMAAAIRGQERFDGKRTLVVTGERAEESRSRANYRTFEIHKANAQKRTVHAWRPVHAWTETQVWTIVERWKVNPHPAYRLGWGRTSCLTCIFGSADQWASVKALAPDTFDEIAGLERTFDSTIQRDRSVEDMAAAGRPYDMDPDVAALAMSNDFDEPVVLETWSLPAGAFGDSAGPS